jgi:large subunit ribosomal protein L3
MGSQRKTIQNMMVWAVRSDQNLILIKGSVPGGKMGVVLIKKAKKMDRS